MQPVSPVQAIDTVNQVFSSLGIYPLFVAIVALFILTTMVSIITRLTSTDGQTHNDEWKQVNRIIDKEKLQHPYYETSELEPDYTEMTLGDDGELIPVEKSKRG